MLSCIIPGVVASPPISTFRIWNEAPNFGCVKEKLIVSHGYHDYYLHGYMYTFNNMATVDLQETNSPKSGYDKVQSSLLIAVK